jgi:hypothetical protein
MPPTITTDLLSVELPVATVRMSEGTIAASARDFLRLIWHLKPWNQ